MILYNVYAAIFGAMVGSFLNVIIVRVPAGQNIVMPRSRCPKCHTLIRWFHNIPILSYILLRGKCTQCKTKISWVYPFVELLCGVVAYILFPKYLSAMGLMYFAVYFSIFCVFLCHFIIDLRHQILPDSLNLYLALIFLALGLIEFGPKHSLLGGLIGFLFPYGITWLFYWWKGKIGLGGGDIKLYGALGLYFGPMDIIRTIFLSCFLGSIIGLLFIGLRIMKKDDPLPFGPYILIIAALKLFFPEYFTALKFLTP